MTAEISASDIEQVYSRLDQALAEIDRLKAMLNTPELVDFAQAVVLEAVHQRQRFGAEHDAGKTAADWFWLIGYLAQKAMMSAIAGDQDKALHHAITTASALANWHAQLLGADNSMRPGIARPEDSGIVAGDHARG